MTDLSPDYYALLGVSASADREAIRAAYHALAKQHHPDSGGAGQASDRFLLMQEAYRVLGNPDRRAQYDIERARRQALDEARRIDRDRAYRQSLVPVPSPGVPSLPPQRGLRPSSGWLYLVAVVLVVAAVGVVVIQQRHQQDRLAHMTVVKVDGMYRPGPPEDMQRSEREAARDTNRETSRDASREATNGGLPSDFSALSREMERMTHLQVERVEQAKAKAEAAAKAKLDADAKLREQDKVASAAPGAPAATDGQQVQCSAEGRRFSVLRQHDAVMVSYNGGPMTRSLVHDAGTGMVVVSAIEPTNRISIGFLKGYRDSTVLLIADASGNVFRTIGVDCSGPILF